MLLTSLCPSVSSARASGILDILMLDGQSLEVYLYNGFEDAWIYSAPSFLVHCEDKLQMTLKHRLKHFKAFKVQ